MLEDSAAAAARRRRRFVRRRWARGCDSTPGRAGRDGRWAAAGGGGKLAGGVGWVPTPMLTVTASAEVLVLLVPVAAGPVRHGRVPQHPDDAGEAELHGVDAGGLVQRVPPRHEAARPAGDLVQPDRRVGEEGVRRVVEALPQHAGGRDASQDEVPGVQEQGHGGAGSRRHVGIYPFIFD